MVNELKIKKVKSNAIIPNKATKGSAGLDLTACIDEETIVKSGQTVKFGTGIAIELPGAEYAALVFARSGLSIKHGLAPANCVGLIDSDYRGEIIVGLHNSSQEDYVVSPGERIAQLVVVKLPAMKIIECDELEDTDRGAGGFGSTGKM